MDKLEVDIVDLHMPSLRRFARPKLSLSQFSFAQTQYLDQLLLGRKESRAVFEIYATPADTAN